MNSERQVKESWSRGTYSRLPFSVNVMLYFSVVMLAATRQLSNAEIFFVLRSGEGLNSSNKNNRTNFSDAMELSALFI